MDRSVLPDTTGIHRCTSPRTRSWNNGDERSSARVAGSWDSGLGRKCGGADVWIERRDIALVDAAERLRRSIARTLTTCVGRRTVYDTRGWVAPSDDCRG